LVRAQKFSFGRLATTALSAKKKSKAHGQIGVQTAVAPASPRSLKKAFEAFVAIVARTKAVSVADQELVPQEGSPQGKSVHRDPDLSFHIVFQPHIVVARKNVNRDTGVGNFG